MAVPRLECRGLGKRYGAAVALADVDFSLTGGEIHGLVGVNGAGKSTLVKVLAGAVGDYSGQILLDGRPVELGSPQAALAHGVAMVYQELSGVGQLSVAENICLGRQPTTRWGRIDWSAMRRLARTALAELDLKLDVDRRLDSFPLAIRQLVEIARGLSSGAGVLVLDEPTSALAPPETRRLFARLARLRERGVSLVFISHFIEDVLEICDRVTILRDGRRLETAPAATLEKHAVIHAMLGHSLARAELGYEAAAQLPQRSTRVPRLVARGLCRPGAFQGVDLEVAPGECLGLYGFVGAGHQELAHALAGVLATTAGQVRVADRPLPRGRVDRAVAAGVVLVAADREQSLVGAAPIFKNVTLAHLKRRLGRWLSRGREQRLAQPWLERVGCRPALPGLRTSELSGGNQQKVVLAKWLLGPIEVLVLDEPTRGMDVGAKEEVMRLVATQQQAGAAVVLASSEPELLLAHADRILVLRKGRITREFVGQSVDKSSLLREA